MTLKKINQTPLWRPTQEAVQNSQMNRFRLWVNDRYQLNLVDYFALHQWSVNHPALFWESVAIFTQVIFRQKPQKIYQPGLRMQDTQWFLGAELNFAENLLRYRDNKIAIQFISEDNQHIPLSYQELYQQVTALANWLRKAGLNRGDCVVGILPNCPATVVAMLATTSIGAVWSACSPDFGLQGLLDRFGQIKPKILIASDGYRFNGKIFNKLETISHLQDQLPSLQQTIILPFLNSEIDLKLLRQPVYEWQDCLNETSSTLVFETLPFGHPLYILYSSGTTDKPKCMVHGAGGTMLQHLKELMLHTDLHRQDTIFFYTTCAWMMWHWLISSLAVGARLILYDGNPFYPHKNRLFDLIDQYQISVFGVGAKLIETAKHFNLQPMQTHALTPLRTILTTGSPLLPESFDYVYQHIKSDICLSSISGGSDIISCFALGNPVLPVYRGELQCIGLGMDVKIFDGELVCTTPFPSMPLYFWNDPDGEKYQRAYFDKFPNVWTHGDYAQLTIHGGLIIYGRSDATLNPGGIRIGTSEIYQQLEKFEDVLESLAVGQQYQGSERIILFVIMKEDKILTSELIQAIKTMIRTHTSPHHVPYQIIQAKDFPRTVNGKLMETLVKKIINHQPINISEALANPESLEFFKEKFQKNI